MLAEVANRDSSRPWRGAMQGRRVFSADAFVGAAMLAIGWLAGTPGSSIAMTST
jgi:hypothetical protein